MLYGAHVIGNGHQNHVYSYLVKVTIKLCYVSYMHRGFYTYMLQLIVL